MPGSTVSIAMNRSHPRGRSAAGRMLRTILRGAAVILAAGAVRAQSGPSGGNATIYIGSYAGAIQVMDEATMTVTARIPMRVGIPVGVTLSHDRKRLYALDATVQRLEVVDLATRASVDTFSLTRGNQRVRIGSLSIDPLERFAVMLVRTTTKLPDRFQIGPPTLIRYDLRQHRILDTIPWPAGQEREFARTLFSPDGSLLYFLTEEDILIYGTGDMKEVDRWNLSQALDQGMGRFNFGFPPTVYEEPGFYTGLFRVTDPVQHRRMMGVARVNLAARTVDFSVIGPDESVSFVVAPGRTRAYGLHAEVGNYEFWAFDLESRRVLGKSRFNGRPRMSLAPSSNGRLLYIYTAGNTIDIYEAASYRYLRTVALDADMTSFIIVPPAAPARGGS
jgi:DNA-binding beta-propeller fold protein YncE